MRQDAELGAFVDDDDDEALLIDHEAAVAEIDAPDRPREFHTPNGALAAMIQPADGARWRLITYRAAADGDTVQARKTYLCATEQIARAWAERVARRAG